MTEADSLLKGLTSEKSRSIRRQLRNKDRRSWLPTYVKDGRIEGVPEMDGPPVSLLASVKFMDAFADGYRMQMARKLRQSLGGYLRFQLMCHLDA